MKKIRRFLGIILSMFLLINLRVNVMAQENNQEVLLTEEMALNLASNYAAIFTDKELVPCNPTKLYETDGQAMKNRKMHGWFQHGFLQLERILMEKIMMTSTLFLMHLKAE